MKSISIKRFISIFLVPFLLLIFIPPVNSEPFPKEKNYLKKYNFTTDWFSHNIPTWKVILSEFSGKEDLHYLEIGVFEGRSFFWMIENILTHPTSSATGIDPFFQEGVEERFNKNLEISGLGHKTKILKGLSQEELRKFDFHLFNIIYIDGDHNASAVLNDAILSWPLLKKGGLLIFDDYNFAGKHALPNNNPKIAIDTFISFYNKYLDVIQLEAQCIIRKKILVDWERY